MAKKVLLQRFYDIDLRLLRIFKIVVQCGGLAASEFELNIGRSTISRHLSDLETRLKMKLCSRGPSGFLLSREGHMVLEATERLMTAIDVFENEVDDIHRNIRGTFKLASFDLSSGNPDAFIEEAIARFEKIAPEVNLELSTQPPNVIEAGVVSGSFDLGIVPVHRQSASLDYEELYDENMALYCGYGHEFFGKTKENFSLKKLSTAKYAGFDFNSPNMVAGQKLKLRVSARVHNEEALSVLILSGRYLGFLPVHVAAPFVSNGTMSPIMEKQTQYTTTLAAISRKRPKPGRKTQIFLRCLEEAHAPQDTS